MVTVPHMAFSEPARYTEVTFQRLSVEMAVQQRTRAKQSASNVRHIDVRLSKLTHTKQIWWTSKEMIDEENRDLICRSCHVYIRCVAVVSSLTRSH